MSAIKIKGDNSLDTDIRLEAMQKLNQLPTKILKNMASLANSKKAHQYLGTEEGMIMIRSVLG